MEIKYNGGEKFLLLHTYIINKKGKRCLSKFIIYKYKKDEIMNRKQFIENMSVLSGILILDKKAEATSKFGKARQNPADRIEQQQDRELEKAFGTMRLAPPRWVSEKQYDEILNLLNKYKSVADEIAFFTGASGSGIPLDAFKGNMNILRKRMAKARKKGFRAGLNLFVTLGHRDEDLKNSLKGDYTHMTGIDGIISKGCYCPNHEDYQIYLKKKYRIASETNPDFIWIDDDARMSNHGPVKYACLCKKCLEIFEKETGMKVQQRSFKKAMNVGTIEEKLKNRKAWLQHNRNTMDRLCSLIEGAVHEVNSDIEIGFMSGDRFYDGYDFENYANILAGKDQSSTMWRPGGGFYVDYDIRGLSEKAHAIGRQSSVLPNSVFSIQSEIECVPCQRLEKAAKVVVLEVASYIAAGCTGATYSILPYYKSPLSEYEPLLTELQQAQPFFDLMVKTLGRSKIRGLQTFWNKNTFITGNIIEGNWLNSSAVINSHELYDIGLPACYSNDHADVTILQKDNIFALSKAEIKMLLTKSVYMDWEALNQLNKSGFKDLTGFELFSSNNNGHDVWVEKYLKHSLNGEYSGYERRGFPQQVVYALKKTDVKSEALTILYDFADQGRGIGMGIFENKLGGRICVAGYYPFTVIGNLTKSWQMKSIFKWCSRDNIVGYVTSFHKINLWIREPRNNHIVLAFTNSSFDPARDLVLMLKTDKTRVTLYRMDCKATTILSSGKEGNYQKFVIPHVESWGIRLLETE